jgi:hypothetical protein
VAILETIPEVMLYGIIDVVSSCSAGFCVPFNVSRFKPAMFLGVE